jgi:hypothetical protein
MHAYRHSNDCRGTFVGLVVRYTQNKRATPLAQGPARPCLIVAMVLENRVGDGNRVAKEQPGTALFQR